MTKVSTTCPYCGVGCGLTAVVEGDKLLSVQGDETHPANRGQLCIKGQNLPATLRPETRLLEPEVFGKVVDWSTAINAVADGFAQTIAEHGPDAVAFYLSGQLLTEDYYVANKLMKGFMGSANVDTNSRLCMASAVAAHKRAFGEDVVPCDYADLDLCSLVVLIGSNAAWTHPVLYQRLEARKEAGDVTVIVIDPRRTATCEIADLHLPLKPGSDISLFNGLLRFLAVHGVHDTDFVERHSNGYEQALEAAMPATPELVSELTGLPLDQLLAFYRLFAVHQRTVSVFSQGINQSRQGTDQANAIINCHLATGRIAKPGTGPFSITGQPNAMGGREVGGMANQLAAHMDFNPINITRVSQFWRAKRMASRPGLKALDMFDSLVSGEIKAIWIMGTNPAVSLPNRDKVRQGLAKCPLVVVSDCVANTDTSIFADIKLPALAWAEKDGTVTNSARVVSRQRGFLAAAGSARPDWQIVSAVGAALGYEDHFSYRDVGQVFAEHARLTSLYNDGERLLNLSHLADLDEAGYEQLRPTPWPRLGRAFEDLTFSTKDGRACFVPVQQLPVEDIQTGSFTLNTGRVRDQWHTMTRTGLAAELFMQIRAPYVTVHPDDAELLGVVDQDLVTIRSDLGKVSLLVEVSEDISPGQLFAPIHWNDQFASNACVSELVPEIADPISGQPQSKSVLVNCEKQRAKTWVQLVTRFPIAPAELKRRKMRYWSGSPIKDYWQYTVGIDDFRAISALLPKADVVSYEAPGVRRQLGRESGEANWLLFAGDHLANLPTPEYLCAQFAATDVPDWTKLSLQSVGDVSRLVCTCFEVSEEDVATAIAQGCCSVDELGQRLRCGTNCGSCKSDLRRLLRASSGSMAANA